MRVAKEHCARRTLCPSGFVIRNSSFGFPRLRRGGYLLLELILALALFSLAVTGLVRSLQMGIQTAAILSRENDIRVGLRSFLEEVRRKPLNEMSQTLADERLGVTYQSEVEELSIQGRNGNVLRDLHRITAFAVYQIGAEERKESVEMWVYKPRSEGRQ
ncbi:hypothetical protein AYO49_00015 [Verrucomicrobiaceae bacterium SCGC AG-212-N21]|nr:hypothetical protein AYO49_00015 [Verrucomicrobiaceae bacterium SCGC AG-212-N21]